MEGVRAMGWAVIRMVELLLRSEEGEAEGEGQSWESVEGGNGKDARLDGSFG